MSSKPTSITFNINQQRPRASEEERYLKIWKWRIDRTDWSYMIAIYLVVLLGIESPVWFHPEWLSQLVTVFVQLPAELALIQVLVEWSKSKR